MKSDKSAALLLLGAAALGLVLANSPMGQFLLDLKFTYLAIEPLNLKLTVEHWVSDLVLATFFLVAGLELKYELSIGVLSRFSTALVPVVAGVGGIVLPALIYTAFNWGSPYMVGWPIPTATDIAFALGVLAIFGKGLPKSARVFLLALAIFDDLVAISIIAIFYTDSLAIEWLFAAALILAAHAIAERFPRLPIAAVRVLSFLLAWYAVYQSGVHATVNPALLVFTPGNWNIPQDVAVTAVDGDRVTLADLRFGTFVAPPRVTEDFIFRFAARREGEGLQFIAAEGGPPPGKERDFFPSLWRRIWGEPSEV